MESWYRIAFTEARVVALDFAEACRRIFDRVREAAYPQEVGIFITDDWIRPRAGDEPSLVTYLSPAAAEMFSDLLVEFEGETCSKPLPFGLNQHGHIVTTHTLEWYP